MARMMSDTYGPTSPGSFKRFDPALSSSKMSPAMFRSASTPFCATFEEWATKLRLGSSQRQKQAQRISANGSSSWPTARVSAGSYTRDRGEKGKERPSLEGAARDWPTVAAANARQTGGRGTRDRKEGENLHDAAKDWQTPATDSFRSRGGDRKDEMGLDQQARSEDWATPAASLMGYETDPEVWNARGMKLQERGLPKQGKNLGMQSQAWSTPAARDWKGENSTHHTETATGRAHMDQLPNQVAHGFQQPHPGQMNMMDGPKSCEWRPISRRLFRYAMSNASAIERRRWLRKGSWKKRRLNPWFVEWLMAWPSGHGLSSCTETAFIHWQRRMRSELLDMPWAFAPWIWQEADDRPEQQSLF